MEEEKDLKDIEIRSEEVQEVMGQLPAWIVRWGITILFLVVIVLVVGSFFFRYPDVIETEMTLTTTRPVAHIMARSTGRISKVYIANGEEVKKGSRLAIIENPATIEDIDKLEYLLNRAAGIPDSAVKIVLPVKDLSLGEIQSGYVTYLRCLHEYDNYVTLEYYPKKIASIKGQIERYRNYYESQLRQHKVTEAQHSIALQQYSRDSLLFVRNVISPSEHEAARADVLQSYYSYESSLAGLENQRIQIAQLEENLLDLELQQLEKETVLLQDYRTALEQLQNDLTGWRLTYTLVSPVDGVITFTKYWNENQNITAGESVFTVIPKEKDELLGVAMLPLIRSGKVKTGQRVIIRFANFPDQEFGVVNGKVKQISLVPNEDNYRVEVELPNGLVTNYGKELPLSQEMQATAEIVTEELRLITRFFQPLKKILKEGFDPI